MYLSRRIAGLIGMMLTYLANMNHLTVFFFWTQHGYVVYLSRRVAGLIVTMLAYLTNMNRLTVFMDTVWQFYVCVHERPSLKTLLLEFTKVIYMYQCMCIFWALVVLNFSWHCSLLLVESGGRRGGGG